MSSQDRLVCAADPCLLCHAALCLLSQVVAISAAKFHSAAVTADGQLLTWGWGRGGRLGELPPAAELTVCVSFQQRALACRVCHVCSGLLLPLPPLPLLLLPFERPTCHRFTGPQATRTRTCTAARAP